MPSIIDFYGAKTAIILGEIGFVVYIAANFYPSIYVVFFCKISPYKVILSSRGLQPVVREVNFLTR